LRNKAKNKALKALNFQGFILSDVASFAKAA
jgi:hypothetical protein